MKTLNTVIATAVLLMASTLTAQAHETRVQNTGGGITFGFNVGSPGWQMHYGQGWYGPNPNFGPRHYGWKGWRHNHRQGPYAWGKRHFRGYGNPYGFQKPGHGHKKFRKGFRKGYRQGFRDGANSNVPGQRLHLKRHRGW